jgi:hypothetical protein
MIMRLFARLSGLSKIIEHYSTSRTSQGEKLVKQTIQIGAVRYRKCVFIDIDTQGFYFCIRTVFGKCPQIFLPWDEFGNIRESEIYGKKAKQFSIGEPPIGTIRIPEAIFNKMENYLKAYREIAVNS